MNHDVILITGGSGYIGSHFVWMLTEAGIKPLIFDISPPANAMRTRAHFFQGDINEIRDLKNAFLKYKPSTIVHLAAQTHIVSDGNRRGNIWDVNTLGCKNVLDAAKTYGCHRLIFTSSTAVYGDVPGSIVETRELRPISMYGKTKKAFEELLVREAKKKSISVVVLRLFNVAGYHRAVPLSFRVKDRDTLIINAIRAQKQHTTLTIYGRTYDTKDGTAVRDYVHVTDVSRALCAALTYRGRRLPLIVNIGSGYGTTNMDVVDQVENLTHRTVKRTFVRKRRGEVGHSVANIGLARRALDWAPRQSSLANVIQSSIDAYEK